MNAYEQAIEDLKKLSESRKSELCKKAKDYMAKNPGSADDSRFWRCLSARQVTQIVYSETRR